jgi:hypothetical protein
MAARVCWPLCRCRGSRAGRVVITPSIAIRVSQKDRTIVLFCSVGA